MRKYGLGLGNIDWEDFARGAGYASEKKMFEEMYSNRGLSLSEIGERLGYTKWDVLYRLKKHGILRRPWGGLNHVPTQLRRLAHCDQRVIVHGSLREIVKATGVSRRILFTYRRWIKTNAKWEEVYATPEEVAKQKRRNKIVYQRFKSYASLSKVKFGRQ